MPLGTLVPSPAQRQVVRMAEPRGENNRPEALLPHLEDRVHPALYSWHSFSLKDLVKLLDMPAFITKHAQGRNWDPLKGQLCRKFFLIIPSSPAGELFVFSCAVL